MKLTCSRCGAFKEAEIWLTQNYCRKCNSEYHTKYKPSTWERQKRLTRAKSNSALKRGLIQKKPCEVCGIDDTEMHHSDYTKPLDVTWLCYEHHLGLHRVLKDMKQEEEDGIL